MPNKVNYHAPATSIEHKAGDLFVSKDGGVYLLISCNYCARPTWIAVSLDMGTPWNDAAHTIKDAIDGLTFLGRNLNITIG